jgi:polyhydroxyalkanoate synthesis regulator phasin
MREPQVVLQTGSIERELPVTDAVAEVHGRVQDVGSADEIRRQQVEKVQAEISELREQVREVARTFKDFIESYEDGEVEYRTIDLSEGETDAQVEALVERVRSGEISVEEALSLVETPEDVSQIPGGGSDE